MRINTLLCSILIAITPIAAQACDTALVLTMDVSNSVDAGEFQLQTGGLADALQDPEIIDTLVATNAHLAVVQWSGADKQEISIPWTSIQTALDVQLVSQQARLLTRAFVLSDTAPAEAVYFSLDMFDDVPQCRRKVIDISGDGTPNAGSDVGVARNRAEQQGVTINAIAIESIGIAISNFYRNTVITRDGFVITAQQHREYPATLRTKILREISRVLG